MPKHGCLAPIGSGKTCGEKAIRSHTVGLSRDLRSIADANGLVRGAKLKMSAIFDFGNGAFEDIPVKRASVFPGFCHEHDSGIFRPIDDDPWDGSEQHIFLLGYRALCREVYAKLTNVESFMPAAINNAGGAGREELIRWNEGEELGLRESLRDKASMDRKLRSGDFRCNSHVISLGADFPLRVAGVFVPEFDYEDRRLYDLSDYATPAHRISVCTHTIENDVLGIFVAFSQEPKLSQYLESLKRVTKNEPRAYFAQACFDNFEHIYFSISWWNQLRERHRIGIENRFEISGPGRRPHGMSLDPIFQFV